MKRFIIIAGVNGAGKSTFYASNPDLFVDIELLNVDSVVRQIGDWHNYQDVLSAGKIIVSRIKECFDSGSSFCQETTLCGKSILNNITKANKLGYKVELYYIGLDNIEMAKERVRKRVQQGGHGIPEKDIERRYSQSLNNLHSVFNKCDVIHIYDNSEQFRSIAIFQRGQCIWTDNDIPNWCVDIIQ